MEFFELLKQIVKAEIRFVVVGGIAVNLHGIERPTKDIDLVVYLEEKNLLKFLKLMAKLDFQPKVPVGATEFADPKKRADWIKNKNMIVFSFCHSRDMMRVIDVFVKHPLPFGPMYRRKEMIVVDDIKIPVISILDLIKLKQKARRAQDRADIVMLQKVLRTRKEL
ncbi:MAG: nucleotidyltransferase [Deltaproteobacteria bacterium]|nr:nucleotidyltransferase [Deltaproteobacteria bacterium]